MSRFVLALLAAAVTICLTSVIHAAPQDNLVGRVLFLEGGSEGYLRQSFSEGIVEEKVISGEDTAAAIAVLLGVPPPVTLSSASSARLNSLLSPNPFKRPDAVVALTIRGIISESPFFKEIVEITRSSPISKQRLISANAFQRPQELPGRDVSLHSLNYGEYTHDLKQGLKDLGSFLEGRWNDETESEGVLSIPLPHANGLFVPIDLAERADRQFAKELLSLLHVTQSAPRLQDVQTHANLVLGTFSALELMEEGSQHRQDATRLFLHTAARVLSILEAEYKGQMVGVVTLLSTAGTQVPLFSIVESRSSRSLLDESLAPSPSQAPLNQTLHAAEIKLLLSRSLLVVTTLILLIASGLGSCFLFLMPLTRDTLLYANVKLD